MKRLIIPAAAVLAIQIGCTHSQYKTSDEMETTTTTANNLMAKADMESKSNSEAKGEVNFTQSAEGLLVEYNIEGLEKNKKHGFHVHEKGDCSSPDAKSAGRHYKQLAPMGGTAKDSPQKHAGDLPMITANNEGKAEGRFVVKSVTLDSENPIRGRAIIVHGGPDNPRKNSPPRIACGVIR